MSLENEIVRLRESGLKYKDIMLELGCSKGTVSKYCRKNGISVFTGEISIPEDIVKVLQEKYDGGASLRSLSKDSGYNRSIITKYITNIRTIKRQTCDERKKSIVKNVISWRKRKKKALVEYKGGKCIICGYNKSIRALEFHHLDPTEKDFGISGKSLSFEKLKKEVDKCILVCSNCHCEIHDGIIDTDKYINLQQRKVERPPYEQLLSEITELGYTGTGRKYNVSDNAIRKWRLYYEKYK